MNRTNPAPALAAALFAAALAACAAAPPVDPAAVPELTAGSGFLDGYLRPEQLPRSDLFLPDAPKAQPPGSNDAIAAQRAFDGRGSARWQLAVRDADLSFPGVAAAFACDLGFEPTLERTPHLAMLMRRSLSDAGRATAAAKGRYMRVRPFVELEQVSCTPAEEPALRTNGSYPSGHASRGWALALVLAQVAPERQDALLRRGYAFGQSRVHCGVHWQSDVEAGRVVGAATVAALANSATFLRQAELARVEVRAEIARPAAAPDAALCAAQAETLAGF